MESESLVMVRCPECGGLMLEGKECRVCAGGPVPRDGTYPTVATTGTATGKKGGFPIMPVVLAALLVLVMVAGAVAVLSTRGSDPTIEGWHKVEGRGVSLLLPAGWMGGEPGTEVLDQVLMTMRSYGQNHEALAGALEANPDALLLFAVDQAAATDGFATNVNVVAEEAPDDTSVESYLEATRGQLPASFRVQESGVRNVGRYSGGRIVTVFDLPPGRGQQVAYIIKDGRVFWIVTYTTSVVEFANRINDFERSAATIRLD